VNILDSDVFSNCSSLTEVIIPEGVKEIRGWDMDIDGAFFGCTSLRYVSIPRSMKEIGDGAFDGCDNLTSVSVPRHTKVEDYAFPEHTEVIRY
jgi:hypothetical protein